MIRIKIRGTRRTPAESMQFFLNRIALENAQDLFFVYEHSCWLEDNNIDYSLQIINYEQFLVFNNSEDALMFKLIFKINGS